MGVNRRDFLRTGVSVGSLAMLPRWFPSTDNLGEGSALARSALEPAPITDPTVRELVLRAVEAARAAGATYADVRLTHTRGRDFDLIVTNTPPVGEYAEYHAGVRALVNGYWGFAAGTLWTPDEVARLGREAVHQAQVNALGQPRVVELGHVPVVKDGSWVQPVERDPFQVPEGEILDFCRGLMTYAQRKSRTRGPGSPPTVPAVSVKCKFERQDKAFASSEGSYYTQRRYRTAGQLNVFLVVRGTPYALSSPIIAGASRGWEYVREAPLREEVERLAEEILADAALPLKPVEVGRYQVVFDAQSMATLLAQTLGCATDLARALGYRAHELGTSYLKEPLAMLGSYSAGAPLLTVLADRTTPGGLATVKWDDDGVEPDQFPLVQDGVLMDFQTHREGAGWLKEAYAKQGRPGRSHGCAAAASAFEAPAITMPNLTLAPGPEALDFDGLVGGLTHGLAVKQLGVQMDWQCLNGFAKGRPALGVFEVRNGKRLARLAGAQLLLRAPEFWQALTALGGAASQQPFAQGSGTVRAVPAVVKQVTTIQA